MEFRILGPLEVRKGERVVALGRKQRALVAVLLLNANEVVSAGRLIDALWGEQPPETAGHALQVHVSQLRKAFEQVGARNANELLITRPPGYMLRVDPAQFDRDRFIEFLERGGGALERGAPERAAADLREALALWRGPALADFAYDDFAQSAIGHLDELRLTALESRIDADLGLGRHVELVPELETLVREHPLRERLRLQLMLALYRSGRQADALAVYQNARRTLVDELGLDPSRALQELEQAILRHDPALDPPARRRTRTAATSLPTPPTPLVGRTRELADACSLASRDDVRLLTFTGPGGIGKTRLALEVARRLADDFDDGAVFVDLGPIGDPALLAPTLLKALGVVHEGAEPPLEALEAEAAGRSVLLLLDSFDRVLPEAPVVARLVAAAPRVMVLVTSRAVLRLSAEHEFAVAPLGLPAAADSSDVRAIAEAPASALFVQRAEAATREFALTEESARLVSEICARADGLPLAIELAAARVKVMGLETILARLGSRLQLLTGGPRDAPARQQTLRTTIDWSYELLTPAEQRLFARLAAFAGGCTLAAVEATCADAGIDVVEGLASLVDKSFLRRLDGGDSRFAMLDTIREYALERLAESAEETDARRRHAQHFAALAREAEPELEGRQQAAWLSRLELEHDNLRAALAFALESGDSETALSLANSLGAFWIVHGHLREGRRWLEAALAQADATSENLGMRALNALGIVAGEQGDLVAAEAAFEASLRLARSLDDAARTANVLVNLGNLALFQGEYERARALYREAASLSERSGNARGLAIALENLGLVAFCEDDVARAIEPLEASQAVAREAGDTQALSAALRSLARAVLVQGDAERAAVLLSESVTLARELGQRHALAECLEAFAGVAFARADAQRAALLFGAADVERDAIGAPRMADQRAWYERLRHGVETDLGERAFQAAYARGRSLPVDRAIDEALRDRTRGAPAVVS